MNLDLISDRREKISLKFATDGLKYGTMTDLLKKKDTTLNNIKKRKSEPYDINFAHRERTRKSSIIYLQNLLNNEK